MSGRLSVGQPSRFHGVRPAHSSASSRSRTSRKMKPPSCSLVSMNGPSVTWRPSPPTRMVVAACDPSSPSQAISTPAAPAASPKAAQPSNVAWISSGDELRSTFSSPYNVSSTFMTAPPSVRLSDHAEDERGARDRQRLRANFDAHRARQGAAEDLQVVAEAHRQRAVEGLALEHLELVAQRHAPLRQVAQHGRVGVRDAN